MCYNQESSIIIYVFVIAAAIKMFLEKNIYYGVILLVYGGIQLAEFLIWFGMKTKRTNFNYVGSLLVGLIISIQPLVLAITANETKRVTQGDEVLRNGNYAMIAIYTAIVFFIYFVNIKNSNVLSTVDKSSCRLKWNILDLRSNGVILFASILYFTASVIVLYTTESYDIIGIFVGSFVASVIYTILIGKSYNFGSLWCFSAIVASIVLGFFIF